MSVSGPELFAFALAVGYVGGWLDRRALTAAVRWLRGRAAARAQRRREARAREDARTRASDLGRLAESARLLHYRLARLDERKADEARSAERIRAWARDAIAVSRASLLDAIARQIPRRPKETDESYRRRLLAEVHRVQRRSAAPPERRGA